ncbi:MAG: lipid II flippase MurJ, partial [Christensenella hongkongensis]
AALKQHDKLKSTVRQSLEIVALITLPIIVVAFVNSQDIIGMFYQRGKFTLENTLFTAPIFAFYILGIFAFGMRNFLTRVFYALQLNKIPMFIGIFSVTLNIVLDMLLKDVLGAKGLTLATSIASFAGAIIMIIVLRKRIGNMHLKRSSVQFIKILIAAGACAVVTILLHQFLPIEGTDFGHNAARLLSSGLSGIAVFAIVAYLLKIEMAGKLMRGAKNRLRRKKT